ncbi:hypothetical protein BGY98DRAFT_270049 [Russula aff. rugulosa BPL654]|nr:hypothetical protein BGY98DRAFT_270049 [Russula aff. rugulosa BPL654]
MAASPISPFPFSMASRLMTASPISPFPFSMASRPMVASPISPFPFSMASRPSRPLPTFPGPVNPLNSTDHDHIYPAYPHRASLSRSEFRPLGPSLPLDEERPAATLYGGTQQRDVFCPPQQQGAFTWNNSDPFGAALLGAVALAPNAGYSFGMPPPAADLFMVPASDIYNGRSLRVFLAPKSPDFIDAAASSFTYDSSWPRLSPVPPYRSARYALHSPLSPSGLPHFEPCRSHGWVHLSASAAPTGLVLLVVPSLLPIVSTPLMSLSAGKMTSDSTSGCTSRASGSHSPNLSSVPHSVRYNPIVCPPWRARVVNASTVRASK